MNKLTSQHSSRRVSVSSRLRLTSRLMAFSLLVSCTLGCSIFHPVRGVPASYLPQEFEGVRRGGKRTINPSLLVQTPPDQHRVAAGDVLSIYIPGVLGRRETEVNAIGVEPPINQPFSPADPPTIGYPITVRDDQTIALPQIPPIYVLNKTLHEVELAIRKAYTEDFNILRADEAMVLVSLQRPRVHRVLVVRQETGNELASSGGGAGSLNIGVSKRGTARIVTLNAYENDVLHALAMEEGVDGLPGLDAENTIYIIRRRASGTSPELGSPPLEPQYPVEQIQQPMPGYPGGFGEHSSRKQSSMIQLASAASQDAAPAIITADYRTGSTGHQFREAGNIQQVSHRFAGYQLPPAPQPAPLVPPAATVIQSGPAVAPSSLGIGLHPYPHQFQNSTRYPNHLMQPSDAIPPTSMEGSTPFGLPANPQLLNPVPSLVDGSYRGVPMDHQWSHLLNNFDPTIDNPNVIRIPIRLAPGEQPHINEEMIKLNDGDIVFIESRETDVIYTGGLLGGGQYTLPREYDLGVLEAISIAEGRNANGGGQSRSIGGVSALNRDVSVSASRVIILRTLQTGQRIIVEVNLHKAMKYQEENILVQPGDMLILQYTTGEAIMAFTQRYIMEGAIFSLAAAQLNTTQ